MLAPTTDIARSSRHVSKVPRVGLQPIFSYSMISSARATRVVLCCKRESRSFTAFLIISPLHSHELVTRIGWPSSGILRSRAILYGLDILDDIEVDSTRRNRNPAFCTLPTVSRLSSGPNFRVSCVIRSIMTPKGLMAALRTCSNISI